MEEGSSYVSVSEGLDVKRLCPSIVLILCFANLAPVWATHHDDWRSLYLQLDAPDLNAFQERVKRRLKENHWTCDVELAMLSPYQLRIGFNADRVKQAELLKAAMKKEITVRLLKTEERIVPRGTPEPFILELRSKDGKPLNYAYLRLQGATFRLENSRAILDLKETGYSDSHTLEKVTFDDARKMFGPHETKGNITTFVMEPLDVFFPYTYFLDTKFDGGKLTSYRLRSYRATRDYEWEKVSDRRVY